ncbi:hypothetical protein BCR44DRAFT_263570 [Catenaria anguillulae PL171]|uniref:Uncharacterized protein n=1 Tax=Catenaria anguillulae PL171 TaxID=765915 RepID=A0A1Y2H820_9FUNG|nr:hypothetical protein BCR44DRAFT_263570 [Catenaria anguillulae PL171]
MRVIFKGSTGVIFLDGRACKTGARPRTLSRYRGNHSKPLPDFGFGVLACASLVIDGCPTAQMKQSAKPHTRAMTVGLIHCFGRFGSDPARRLDDLQAPACSKSWTVVSSCLSTIWSLGCVAMEYRPSSGARKSFGFGMSLPTTSHHIFVP